MSGFNGSGTFQISGVGLPYTSNTIISSTVANQLNTDLATGLSNCITKDGQQVITANIGWNNYNINNLSSLGVGTASPTGLMHVVTGATTGLCITSSADVGIGTTTPSVKFEVNGSTKLGSSFTDTTNIAGQLSLNGVLGPTGWYLRSAGPGLPPTWGTIGNGSPGYMAVWNFTGSTLTYPNIYVGTGQINIGGVSAYQLSCSIDSAAKPSTNTWTIASDARVKTVTGEYTKGLDAICALRPITYEYNGKAGFAADGKENISIIAQEAIDHFPECVGTYKTKLNPEDTEETELYNWNGHAITFALINAVKELKAQLDAVKTELEVLKAK